jgi:uncharacterized protein YbbK (DUF523 family)
MHKQLSATASKPVIGIGSCLAGNAVRYDGQAKNISPPVQAICETFELRAFCPEMGVGMGVPRPPIQLVGSEHAVRVLDVATHSKDYTRQLTDYAQKVLDVAPNLCGYLLVRGSPSCGYEGVKRHSDDGDHLASDQQGIFARALAVADPLLPLEDDERLSDPALRESFMTRAHVYHDWKLLCGEGVSPHKLLVFYNRHKSRLMPHHKPDREALERILADTDKVSLEELSSVFITALMATLGHPGCKTWQAS